jgi:hypothetical protein
LPMLIQGSAALGTELNGNPGQHRGRAGVTYRSASSSPVRLCGVSLADALLGVVGYQPRVADSGRDRGRF